MFIIQKYNVELDSTLGFLLKARDFKKANNSKPHLFPLLGAKDS